MPDNRGSPMDPFDHKFLKDRYDFELARKEQLTSALALPVGVLGGLGSAMALMARSFSWESALLTGLFAPILVIDIVCFVLCMYCLSRAYVRQTYMFLPKLAEIESARDEWRAFYEAARARGADADYLEHEFRKRIIEAADQNTDRNDARSGWLHRSRLLLITVLWLTAVAGIPYGADQVRFAMPTQEAPRPQPQPAPSTQNTTQPPAFPPNREVREGDVPRRR
jgi:hypothetical protein